MDGDDWSTAPELPLLAELPSGLLLLQLCSVFLALVPLIAQSWLPSRQEQEVIDAIEGQTAGLLDLQSEDFVEWELSPCYGDCPSYRVRLNRQGGVEFEGLFYTCQLGVSRRRISEQQAAAVLAATEAALRHPARDSRLLDSSKVAVAARIAGRSRRLELSGLDGSASQLPIRRLLDDGGRILLDASWLPVWTFEGATCEGSRGERIPFHPELTGSLP